MTTRQYLSTSFVSGLMGAVALCIALPALATDTNSVSPPPIESLDTDSESTVAIDAAVEQPQARGSSPNAQATDAVTMDAQAVDAQVLEAERLEAPSQEGGIGSAGFSLGTQVIVVNGDTDTESGVGVGFRATFLQFLGFEFSYTGLDSTEAVYMPSTFRTGLLIQPVRTEYFSVYLSPGLGGRGFGDAFNPVGDSTYYRIGGGLEITIVEGLALGGDVHWTLPSEALATQYADEHGDELIQDYLTQQGYSEADVADFQSLTAAEIQALRDQASIGDVLEVVPLDRVEVTIGLRWNF